MTFQTMTAWQAALVALTMIAAVVWIFFLKLRHAPAIVPSLLLWTRVLDRRRTSSWRERLRRILSLLLALTIGLLVALAPARPALQQARASARRVAIVIDTSPSMLARVGDGRTRWDRALERARRLVEAGGPHDRFLIAGTAGARASTSGLDRAAALEALAALRPSGTGTPAQFPVLALDAWAVFFITDGVAIDDVPSGVEVLSVFEPADNVGITAFEVRRIRSPAAGYEAIVEVANFSAGPKAVEVAIEAMPTAADGRVASTTGAAAGAGDAICANRTMRLTPQGIGLARMDLNDCSNTPVRATVRARNDALGADDEAYGWVPGVDRVEGVLVTNGNAYLETILSLEPGVALRMVPPAAYRPDVRAAFYVFDGFAPSPLPDRPTLVFRPAPGQLTEGSTYAPPREAVVLSPRISAWDGEHPVLRAVSRADLHVGEALALDLAGATTIVAAGRVPLVAASEHPVKRVFVTFALSDSDFPLQPGFPIFMQNVLAWFGVDRPVATAAPGQVIVPLREATVTTWDGREVRADALFEATTFEAERPGLFLARSGRDEMKVAVNIMSRRLSNINGTSVPEATPADGRRRREWPELWLWMVAAAAALLAGEWWTYHRRITV